MRRRSIFTALLFGTSFLGLAGIVIKRKSRKHRQNRKESNQWARPGMTLTFRAELMPGREREGRSFKVAELLASGRVRLDGAGGEHVQEEFEPVRY